jgi:hypothetical protein
MFQKRHYEALARLVKNSDGNLTLDEWVSYKLIPLLRDDNYRFDKERFLRACYP